jgi:hypothetical protein
MIIPGSLTMRLPAWESRWWRAGRQIDGKRASWRSVKNSTILWQRERR